MPEGPEVRIIADWLSQELENSILLNIGYDEKSRFAKKGTPNLENLEFPLIISKVDTRGKKLILMLTHPELEKDPIFLISFLAMEGKWSWQPGNHSNLWLELKTDDPDLPGWLYFDDSRHFGLFDIIIGEKDFLERMSKIGPDLLSDNIEESEWISVLSRPRLGNKKIALFLLEQKFFSGIGNYLRAEILYFCSLSPHRTLGSLSQDEMKLLFQKSREIILSSYETSGASLRTFRNPHGDKGKFQVVIYNKELDPLGNPIIAEPIGTGENKRTMYWVPEIQK